MIYCNYAIKCQFCPHIETIQLFCCANQLTGFYMRATLALNALVKQQRVPSLTTVAVFIDENIQKYWYLESPVYVVIMQIQKYLE